VGKQYIFALLGLLWQLGSHADATKRVLIVPYLEDNMEVNLFQN